MVLCPPVLRALGCGCWGLVVAPAAAFPITFLARKKNTLTIPTPFTFFVNVHCLPGLRIPQNKAPGTCQVIFFWGGEG